MAEIRERIALVKGVRSTGQVPIEINYTITWSHHYRLHNRRNLAGKVQVLCALFVTFIQVYLGEAPE